MLPTAVYADCLWWICRRKSTATHKNRKRERRKKGVGVEEGKSKKNHLESMTETHATILLRSRLRCARSFYQGVPNSFLGLD